MFRLAESNRSPGLGAGAGGEEQPTLRARKKRIMTGFLEFSLIPLLSGWSQKKKTG
jgi:hypothetical protein